MASFVRSNSIEIATDRLQSVGNLLLASIVEAKVFIKILVKGLMYDLAADVVGVLWATARAKLYP